LKGRKRFTRKQKTKQQMPVKKRNNSWAGVSEASAGEHTERKFNNRFHPVTRAKGLNMWS
jgi:hypothetical protein